MLCVVIFDCKSSEKEILPRTKEKGSRAHIRIYELSRTKGAGVYFFTLTCSWDNQITLVPTPSLMRYETKVALPN